MNKARKRGLDFPGLASFCGLGPVVSIASAALHKKSIYANVFLPTLPPWDVFVQAATAHMVRLVHHEREENIVS